MHIVHLSTRRDFYGGEVCLANLARGLAARGHRVSCLVQPGSALEAGLAGGPANVVPLAMVDWFDPGTVARVRRWLAVAGADADVLATHLPRDWFIAAVAGRDHGGAQVATRHQLAPVSWPVFKRPFLRRCRAVVGVSEAVSAVMRRSGLVPPERVVTIPNGVAAPTGAGAGERLRRLVGAPPTAPVVGMVGRLTPAKGAADLVAAAAAARHAVPDLHVVLIGGGEDGAFAAALRREAVLRGVGDRVHLTGYLPGAADLAAGFDVQVVPSVAEPFGLVTIEALAAGVPVIGTDAGGTPEIVRDGVEGFLVPAGDRAALANRLVCLLESAGLRREMGRRGRARHRERFTLARMLDATEALYRSCRREGARR
ncbi:glycosyltransferase family 4 protein [bacterium]|nr:glycosyltransferase family 4 protein [bacterium]